MLHKDLEAVLLHAQKKKEKSFLEKKLDQVTKTVKQTINGKPKTSVPSVVVKDRIQGPKQPTLPTRGYKPPTLTPPPKKQQAPKKKETPKKKVTTSVSTIKPTMSKADQQKAYDRALQKAYDNMSPYDKAMYKLRNRKK